jgi:hypothetical protein
VAQRLAVQGVQDGVAGTVRSGGASVGLATLAELQGLTAKGTLVDLAFFGARKGNAVVFKLSISLYLRAWREANIVETKVKHGSRPR